MRNIKFLFLITICIVCVLSCTSIAGKDTLYVNITDSVKFVLLPTEGIEQTMDMAQYLSAEFRGGNYFFQSWVKADENAIEMTFFNEMGASIGELSYRNGAAHFSSTVIPRVAIRFIKPEYVIADFQLCFYDPSLLDEALKGIGLTLEMKDHGSRRILSGNEVIIEIEKTENTVKLVNHLRKYTYTMEGDF
ncbi:MAG: DUF3261 domain-containing protein [Treponema sp.]|nr:DUF3261 domain-containing protein [Treponema sp.]